MGFGTEMLFVLILGLVVLGPKRLHNMLAHAARAKADFDRASRGFKSQLAAELDTVPREANTDASDELFEEQ